MARWEITERIDLQKLARRPSFYRDALLTPGDSNSHRITCVVLSGGAAVELSGSAYADYKRADGYKVHAVAEVSGNEITVSVPAEACNFPGMLSCRIKWENTLETLTLLDALFEVRPDFEGDSILTSDEIVLAGGVISYGETDYFDVSGTTAEASDVRDGKAFRQADGTLVTGNADFAVTVEGLSVTAELIEGEDYEIIVSSESAETEG